MTFCLGITVKDGLVGIADTRVTMGTECITARKLSVYNAERRALFIMTSGLRSIRDKAITYFEAALEEGWTPYDRLFKAVNLFAEQVRRVASEDRMNLQASGITFDLHSLVGGQLDKDPHHKLYLVYPQGNWVEIGQGTPYHIIGAAGYGKPILDRTLHFADPLPFALKVGCLAFDSTRISAADVSFPIDVVICAENSFQAVEHRYGKEDLAEMSTWWQERLRRSINELPCGCIEELLSRLPNVGGV
jgi:putative proteasome-type protease